jgi:hypothetical protein
LQSPLQPPKPMESHHPPKIDLLQTFRHHSCLTEIPSYTASGHFSFRSDHSGLRMAWFDEGPCGFASLPPCPSKMTIHMSSLQHLPSQIRLADGGCNSSLSCRRLLLCIQSLCLQVSANPSYVLSAPAYEACRPSRQSQSLPS